MSIAMICLMLPYMAAMLYFAFVLILDSTRKNGYADSTSYKNRTSVSVIIAFRDEESNIGRTLDAVLQQTHKDFVLYLVDDHSSDRSPEIVGRYAHSDKRIKVLQAVGNGKKQAVRQAVEAAESEYIVCTDADCIPGREWLAEIVRSISITKADMVIAPVSLIRNRYGFFQTLDNMSLQAVTAACALAGHATMANGANMAFSRKAYMAAVSGLHFDIASGDDMFLLESIKRNGGKIRYAYSTDATVETCGTDSLKAFLDQRARWLSKAGAYSDKSVVILGIVVFIAQILLILSIGAAFSDAQCLWVWAMKAFADFAVLLPWARFTDRTGSLAYFVPASIIYPFYVIAVAVYGMFANPSWKKRKI